MQVGKIPKSGAVLKTAAVVMAATPRVTVNLKEEGEPCIVYRSAGCRAMECGVWFLTFLCFVNKSLYGNLLSELT